MLLLVGWGTLSHGQTAQQESMRQLPASILQNLDALEDPGRQVDFLLTKIEDIHWKDRPLAYLLALKAKAIAAANNIQVGEAQATYWEVATSYEDHSESEQLTLVAQKLKVPFLIFRNRLGPIWEARGLALLSNVQYLLAKDSLAQASLDVLFDLTKPYGESAEFSTVLGDGLRNQGNLYYVQNELALSKSYYRQAIEQYRLDSIRNASKIALSLMNLAINATQQSGYSQSSEYYQAAANVCPRYDSTLKAEIYLKWAHNISLQAKADTNYTLLQESNRLLRAAQQLGIKDQDNLYYLLGANHQNTALQLYEADSPVYDSLINVAAAFYGNAATQEAISQEVLSDLLTGLIQLFEMGKIKEDKEILGTILLAFSKMDADTRKWHEQKIHLVNSNHQLLLKAERQKGLQTSLALIALLLLSAGIFVFLYQQQRIRNLKQQFAARMEALRSQMNSHFVSNTLNAIDSLIMEGKKEEASNYIVGFSRLCRNILNSSKQPYIGLDEELAILRGYLSFEKLRLGDRLQTEWQLDRSLDLASHKVPSLILQPFVENAIWHGILNKADRSPGKVRISISDFDREHLSCTIQDDGVGRKRARQLRESQTIEWQSWGMKITNERIEAIRKLKDASVEIEDLYDEAGQGVGTRVNIILPKYLSR